MSDATANLKAMQAALTAEDEAILKFESRHPEHAGVKEREIGLQFGLGVVEYYLRLDRILAERSALAYDPILVGRLLRLRERRMRERSRRVSSFGL